MSLRINLRAYEYTGLALLKKLLLSSDHLVAPPLPIRTWLLLYFCSRSETEINSEEHEILITDMPLLC